MSDELTTATRLESLRKEAKRWLKSVRAGDADAIARLRRACPDAPLHRPACATCSMLWRANGDSTAGAA